MGMAMDGVEKMKSGCRQTFRMPHRPCVFYTMYANNNVPVAFSRKAPQTGFIKLTNEC